MFIKNKYTRWYFQIIENASNSTFEIFEKHHIIPKSIGGSNNLKNIVKVTPRQHFICHWLLTKMTEGDVRKKMTYAFWSMCRSNKSHKRTYSSIQYEIARKKFIQIRNGKTFEEIYGIEKAKEIKEKISKKNKGMIKPRSIHNLKRRRLTTHYWEVTHPNGFVEIIENMTDFCKRHNLSPGNISHFGHTKGFRAKKLKEAKNQRYSP